MIRTLTLCLLAVALIACGPTAPADDDDDDASVIDAPVIPGDDGRACENICSADLHDILDCNGNLVETCPAGTGCGANGCVAPCQAAEDNQSSIGRDYYAVDPEIISAGYGACYAAFIANTWDTPITINVERAGVQFPISGFARIPSGSGMGLTYAPLTNGELLPGQVAILFLNRFGNALTSCPPGITPALTSVDAAVHGTGRGAAFHITTSAPVVAYDIFPYGGGASAATSATLLLPTTVWDVNYVAIDAYRKSVEVFAAQPSIAIVGKENNTTVTIRPTAAIVGGPAVASGAAGVPTSYTVQAGEILQFTQDTELIGSVISSDKPIGHWAGTSCLSIDVTDQACDSAHQQIPPVKALGSRYTAVRYRNRHPAQPEESVPWRIVGAVDGTTLSYEPSIPAGAPTTLALGQVAEFWGPGPFIVSSQDEDHPFYISQHMTGCARENPALNDCQGDPEFVNVVPNAQWLAGYTFFTDPTYPETSLVLMRERKNGSFADVTLDCGGTVTGWQPLDAAGDVEYTRVNLVTGNFAPVNGCQNGRHVATSELPFGMVVWGWGSAASIGFSSLAVSYAYPAGASVKPINTVVIIVN